MLNHRVRTSRRPRSFQPGFDSMEGRTLLSAGVAGALPLRSAIVALRAGHRLELRGNLSGSITPSSTYGQGYVVRVTLRGSSGNARLGIITLDVTAATTARQLALIGRTIVDISGVPVHLTASNGSSATALGSLRLSRSRGVSRVPFRMTATLEDGTGALAGASGSFTISGNFNALLGNQLRARLSGNLRAPA